MNSSRQWCYGLIGAIAWIASATVVTTSAQADDPLLQPDGRSAPASCASGPCDVRSGANSTTVSHPAKDSGDAVCEDLAKDRVTRIDYDHMHALFTYYDRDLTVKPGLAKVDVDNDGHPQNVVRAEYNTEHCESHVLAVTDDTRTVLPKNALNELLAGGLTGDRCWVSFSLFRRGGIVYIQSENDLQSSRDNPAAEATDGSTVFVIHGDHAEKVCTVDPFKGLSNK